MPLVQNPHRLPRLTHRLATGSTRSQAFLRRLPKPIGRARAHKVMIPDDKWALLLQLASDLQKQQHPRLYKRHAPVCRDVQFSIRYSARSTGQSITTIQVTSCSPLSEQLKKSVQNPMPYINRESKHNRCADREKETLPDTQSPGFDLHTVISPSQSLPHVA